MGRWRSGRIFAAVAADRSKVRVGQRPLASGVWPKKVRYHSSKFKLVMDFTYHRSGDSSYSQSLKNDLERFLERLGLSKE